MGLPVLTACTSVADSAPARAAAPVALLGEPPARAYRELGRVEVRGLPGSPRRTVHDELRAQARALGAQAVIVQRDVKNYRLPPLTANPRPTSTVGGVYYEVAGIAIRYSDPNPNQN